MGESELLQVPVGYSDPKYTMEIPAILTMTNYQLIIVKKSLQQHSTSTLSVTRTGFTPVTSPSSSPRNRDRLETFYLPLATISRVEKVVSKKEKYLDISCKDFRFVKLSFMAQTSVSF